MHMKCPICEKTTSQHKNGGPWRNGCGWRGGGMAVCVDVGIGEGVAVSTTAKDMSF